MLLTTLARRRPVASGPWIRALCTLSPSASIAGEAKPLAVKRVRQHVNPLARKFREPIAVPDWTQLFARPELPIHLDIGCARGKYLNEVAAQFSDSRNFLGVEIRRSVLEGAKDEAARRGSRNIAFVHANMNAHQHQLLTSLPAPVSSVSIFHPDPWMKKRHVKRRLVTDTFVEELAQLLAPGTPVYVQTDVAELFEYMVEIFDGSKKYQLEPLDENPFPVPTDRESYVRKQGGEIYRIKMIVDEPQQRSETSL